MKWSEANLAGLDIIRRSLAHGTQWAETLDERQMFYECLQIANTFRDYAMQERADAPTLN